MCKYMIAGLMCLLVGCNASKAARSTVEIEVECYSGGIQIIKETITATGIVSDDGWLQIIDKDGLRHIYHADCLLVQHNKRKAN